LLDQGEGESFMECRLVFLENIWEADERFHKDTCLSRALRGSAMKQVPTCGPRRKIKTMLLGTIVLMTMICMSVSARYKNSADESMPFPGTWAEWASNTTATANWFLEYGANWTVPTPPSNHSKTVFVFIGLHPNDSCSVPLLQPVLWWGHADTGKPGNGQQGGEYWSMASWVVDDSVWPFFVRVGNVINRVTVGGGYDIHTDDIIHGEIYNDSTSNSWQIKIWDVSRSGMPPKHASAVPDSFPYDQWSTLEWKPQDYSYTGQYNYASAVLELGEYKQPSPSLLPGQICFSSFLVGVNPYYSRAKPIWTRNYSVNYGQVAGLNVFVAPDCSSWVWLETGESVGGVVVFVNRFSLFAPCTGLALTILAATAAIASCVKHIKRRKEKRRIH